MMDAWTRLAQGINHVTIITTKPNSNPVKTLKMKWQDYLDLGKVLIRPDRSYKAHKNPDGNASWVLVDLSCQRLKKEV